MNRSEPEAPPSPAVIILIIRSGHHYGLKYVGPHNIHMLRPNPQGDGVRRCGPWEGLRAQEQSLLRGTGVLCETPPKSLVPSAV